MKQTILFTLAAFVLLFTACREPDEIDLDLTILAEYDGTSLTMLEKNSYEDLTLRFTTSDFFMSNISLISDENEVILNEVDFLDFSMNNTTSEAAEEGLTLRFENIEPDEYHTIRFGLGVDETNNAKMPADFTSDNVLSNAGLHWPSWFSYVFMRMEGKFDTDENGTFDSGYVFHVGTDDNYAVVELPLSSTLQAGSEKVTIALDHKKLFETPTGYFDIPANPFNHQPDLPGIVLIARNMPDAWSVK